MPLMPSRKHRHERSRQGYRPDAGKPTLWRQNPFRRRVPLAGGARKKALPHARRRPGIGRAKGKPERAQARPVHQGCDRRAKTDSYVVGRSAEIAGRDEVIGLGKDLGGFLHVRDQRFEEKQARPDRLICFIGHESNSQRVIFLLSRAASCSIILQTRPLLPWKRWRNEQKASLVVDF
jgi:hypothetical protein